MAKISPISGKYVVYATITIDGVVDRPDIIGAIFGQTEGLLGAELELRELQRSGRIGRIEVNTEAKNGKTIGEIVIPSSLDKAETAVVAASMEIIERIGPCNSRISIKSIEDIRVAKRQHVIERAKELLKGMQDSVETDFSNITSLVADSVRVEDVVEWGPEKLASGPDVDSNPELVVVEGRADVVNLLKHGFKNVIAMNGSNCPATLAELSKQKITTVFVDGDRGGILNIKELMAIGKVDFIARAPDGKEVEELMAKEIHKALRSKVTPDQIKTLLESKDALRTRIEFSSEQQTLSTQGTSTTGYEQPAHDDRLDRSSERPHRTDRFERKFDRRDGSSSDRSSDRGERNGRFRRDDRRGDRRDDRRDDRREDRAPRASEKELERFASVLDELQGSQAVALLNEQLEVLGKLPTTELEPALEGLDGSVYAVVSDGVIEKPECYAAQKSRSTFIVGRGTNVRQSETRVGIIVIQ
jgi:DNA primase